jgi:hypothetical protein
MTMKHSFTDEQLDIIHDYLELSPWVRYAYQWYMGFTDADPVSTDEVEDFAIAFYMAYNQMHPGTY